MDVGIVGVHSYLPGMKFLLEHISASKIAEAHLSDSNAQDFRHDMVLIEDAMES